MDVLIIGDSVLSGIAASYSGEARCLLEDRFTYHLDAVGCRRLISPGCRVGDAPRPGDALGVLRRRGSECTQALVIGVGYNDITDGDIGVGVAVDRIMSEARRHEIPRVVWLTYREVGEGGRPARYSAHNRMLRAKAADYPDLFVADWERRSRSMPTRWFSEDGLHLGASSASALAEFIADSVDLAIETPVGELPAIQVSKLPDDPAHLTVLVPVRNAAEYLESWLDDVSQFADNVIALDDGSTDATGEILRRHPIVGDVIFNPVRPSYHGWDDLQNRQRLVDIAVSRGSRWLLFLDADERLDADDAAALRDLLRADAQPGFAYGFEVFRMVDDERLVDPRSLWVYRLFAASDAIEPLGSRRLHFVPVPEGIPRSRWLFTSVRIQHFGSVTPTHRQHRYDKYREADPNNECQADYDNLLEDPPKVVPWQPRRPEIPVLLGSVGRYADQQDLAVAIDRPVITAVVIAQNDEDVIDRSLDALTTQDVEDGYEIIVVCSGSDATYARAQSRPGVRCVQLPARALPGEARNAGLWMARGDFITFPGSHVWVLPGSLAARVEAHDNGWDMVTASVVNGNPTRAGQASYFLDHATQTPNRVSGEYSGVPGHVSYVTRDVVAIGGFPEDIRAGEDTVVNRQLYFAGKRTFFSAETQFAHASPSTNVAHLLRHHFQRGRGLGRIIINRDKPRVQRLGSTKSLAIRRVRTVDGALCDVDPQLQHTYRRVRPLVMAGAAAAMAGTWFQLVKADDKAPQTETAPQRNDNKSGPLLALSGRPGEASTGILVAGNATRAAARLQTFARYASAVCPVRTALAPIVTSATVTAESNGTSVVHLAPAIVHRYLDAARTVGAHLLLHIQPGRASLDELLHHWVELVSEPDVGLLFDFRAHVSFEGQQSELNDLIRSVGANRLVLAHGAEDAPPQVIAVDELLDLRDARTHFPHDALRLNPKAAALVYQ